MAESELAFASQVPSLEAFDLAQDLATSDAGLPLQRLALAAATHDKAIESHRGLLLHGQLWTTLMGNFRGSTAAPSLDPGCTLTRPLPRTMHTGKVRPSGSFASE